VRAIGHHGHIAQANDLELKGGRRFGKQDFRYVTEEDVYVCPAGKEARSADLSSTGTPRDVCFDSTAS
jgi:hypothetical protein